MGIGPLKSLPSSVSDWSSGSMSHDGRGPVIFGPDFVLREMDRCFSLVIDDSSSFGSTPLSKFSDKFRIIQELIAGPACWKHTMKVIPRQIDDFSSWSSHQFFQAMFNQITVEISNVARTLKHGTCRE